MNHERAGEFTALAVGLALAAGGCSSPEQPGAAIEKLDHGQRVEFFDRTARHAGEVVACLIQNSDAMSYPRVLIAFTDPPVIEEGVSDKFATPNPGAYFGELSRNLAEEGVDAYAERDESDKGRTVTMAAGGFLKYYSENGVVNLQTSVGISYAGAPDDHRLFTTNILDPAELPPDMQFTDLTIVVHDDDQRYADSKLMTKDTFASLPSAEAQRWIDSVAAATGRLSIYGSAGRCTTSTAASAA